MNLDQTELHEFSSTDVHKLIYTLLLDWPITLARRTNL